MIAILLLLAVCQVDCFPSERGQASKQVLLPLTKDSRAKAAIIIGNTASAPERFAAEELAEYLKRISGADIKIFKESEDAKGTLIVLGTQESNPRIGEIKNRLADLPADSFVIKTC